MPLRVIFRRAVEDGDVAVNPSAHALAGGSRPARTDRVAARGRADGLVFGDEAPFQPSNVWRRAHRAWKRDGLEPIGLHEARHTFASVLIAAGVNAKAITTYMGQASIQTTNDLYGKLMPRSEAEAAALVDAFLARASISPAFRVTMEHT